MICFRLSTKFIIHDNYALTTLCCTIYRFNLLVFLVFFTSMPSSKSWYLIEMCDSNKSISCIEWKTFTNVNQHCGTVCHWMMKIINVGTDVRADKFTEKHKQTHGNVPKYCILLILILNSKPNLILEFNRLK